ncbi:polysaccharide deacetylase family protein [uncultured Paraglaciecola sp.]|uniref:polysaccharide deacetylase family protein n=1 Tax=uncultured Paraglaciecola sp. TaxID=1765024 RepID=UPI002623E3C4|nr:polysaccharide deacetylase family protein [uncultured Paraglaciecola sp.]
MKALSLMILAVLIITGCASSQRHELASNDDFVIVQAGSSDTYASLAQQYLGSKKYAEVLQRYNPQTSQLAGRYVAIPRQVINQSGVYSNGYQQIPVLCYHQFTTHSTSKNKMVVTRAEFERQMNYLASNGYQVISLDELGSFIKGEKEVPIKSVVITIDDGYKSYLDIAYPILKKHKFHSTMFIYPEFIGAPSALKWRDVKDLSQAPLVDIQSHSNTHDSLSPLPSGESSEDYLQRLKFEVEDADKIISKRTNHTIHHFAYPYGNSSLQVIELLEKNDYQLAVTVHKGSNPAFSAPLLLHRTMIYGGDSLNTFKKSLNTFSSMALK